MKNSLFQRAINQTRRPKFLKQGGSYRFEHFIGWLLNQESASSSFHYGLALLAFDGVCLDVVDEAIKCIPYIAENEVCINWSSQQGRVYRYALSPMTARVYSELQDKKELSFDTKQLEQLYAQFCGHKNPKEHFINDQMQWLAMHMSGPLFDHLSGGVKFSAIPENAYARLSSRQRLAWEVLTNEAENKSISQAVIGYFEPAGSDKNPALIDQLIHACRKHVKVADHIAKKQMLKECLVLSGVASEYGPLSSLLLAWGVSLITQGSRSQQNLSPGTISNYIRAASLKLFTELRDKNIQSLSSDEFTVIYKKIINLESDGQQKIAASAISAFHHFLEDWLDAPFVQRLKIHQDEESIPRANVIWQHEIDLIITWLKNSQCDERLIQSWRIAILIGYEKRIRIGELLDICLSDIKISPDEIQIHISGQKTKAAKRTIIISSPLAISELSFFYYRRKKELATGKDFLFGDPKRSKFIYRLGQFYYGLNALLKAATGDRHASYHWLSHSYVSFNLQCFLQGGETTLLNPFSQFATDVGHFSFVTTCHEYMHLHHIPIRKSLNRALSQIPTTSHVAAQWTGIKDSTIRKQVSSKNFTPQEHYWNLILALPISPNHFALASTLCGTENANPPDFLSSSKLISYQTILFLLTDLSKGISIQASISRAGLDEEQFEMLVKTIRDTIFKYQIIRELPFDFSTWQTIQKLGELKKYGFDFEKTLQPKYSSIVAYLNKQPENNDAFLNEGILGWVKLHRASYATYLKLDSSPSSLSFLKHLFVAGADITKMAVFTSDSFLNNEKILEDIRKLFVAITSVAPPFFSVQSRRGRPDFYLVMTEDRVESAKPPYGAATSIEGLHAIHLAALVWVELKKCNQ